MNVTGVGIQPLRQDPAPASGIRHRRQGSSPWDERLTLLDGVIW